VPGGWDKAAGGHGTIHRNGRTEAEYVEAGCSDFRNKRSVWTIATTPFDEAHFATFPPALIEPCILAGCPKGGTVLDPFGGAGTTGLVADRLGRNAILIELNPEYAAMAERRIKADAGMFAEVQS
jgi:DNA modification methylase